MNKQEARNWIGTQGHTNLKAEIEFDGMTLTAGQKFHKGQCSGIAGFSAGVANLEIVGFAGPMVWMAICGDPDPAEWSPKVREVPTVIVKKGRWEDYEIYDARDVVGSIRASEMFSSLS